MIFITGAASSGKTTLVKELKKQLPSDKFDIHDIDEADKWTDDYESWRDAKVEHWLKQSIENRKLGVETILSGIIYPKHVAKLPSHFDAKPIKYILLDATPEAVEERFLKRMESHLNRQKEILNELRNEVEGNEAAHIIDTVNIATDAIVASVIKQIDRH